MIRESNSFRKAELRSFENDSKQTIPIAKLLNNKTKFDKPIVKGGGNGLVTSFNHEIIANKFAPVKFSDDDTPKMTAMTLNQSTKKLHSVNFRILRDISDIADDTRSDLSQIFDLKINPNESDFSSTQCIKPQPRPQSVGRSGARNITTKQSQIIMNNLNLTRMNNQHNPHDPEDDDSLKRISFLDRDFDSIKKEKVISV